MSSWYMGDILSVKPLSPSVKRGDIYFADLSHIESIGCVIEKRITESDLPSTTVSISF